MAVSEQLVRTYYHEERKKTVTIKTKRVCLCVEEAAALLCRRVGLGRWGII